MANNLKVVFYACWCTNFLSNGNDTRVFIGLSPSDVIFRPYSRPSHIVIDLSLHIHSFIHLRREKETERQSHFDLLSNEMNMQMAVEYCVS